MFVVVALVVYLVLVTVKVMCFNSWSTGNNCTQSIKVRESWVKLPDVKPDNSTTETVKQPNYKGRLRKWELKPNDKAQKLRDAPHLFAKSVRDYDRSTPNH